MPSGGIPVQENKMFESMIKELSCLVGRLQRNNESIRVNLGRLSGAEPSSPTTTETAKRPEQPPVTEQFRIVLNEMDISLNTTEHEVERLTKL